MAESNFDLYNIAEDHSGFNPLTEIGAANLQYDLKSKNKFYNSPDPTNNQDLVTKSYLNSSITQTATTYAILAGQTANGSGILMRPFDFPYIKWQGSNIVLDMTGAYAKITLRKGYRYRFIGSIAVTGGSGAPELLLVVVKFSDSSTLQQYIPGATNQQDRRQGIIAYACGASVGTNTAMPGQSLILDLVTSAVDLDVGILVEFKVNVPDNTIIKNQIFVEQLKDTVTNVTANITMPSTYYYYNEFVYTMANASATVPAQGAYFTSNNWSLIGYNMKDKILQGATSGTFVLKAGTYKFQMQCSINTTGSNAVIKVLVRNFTTSANINAGTTENSLLGCMTVNFGVTEAYNDTIFTTLTSTTTVGFFCSQLTNLNSTTDIKSLMFAIEYVPDSNAINIVTDKILDTTGQGIMTATSTAITSTVPINMNLLKITSLANGTTANDVVNYSQLQTKVDIATTLNNITSPTGSVNMSGQKLIGGPSLIASFTNATDYITKGYADTLIANPTTDKLQYPSVSPTNTLQLTNSLTTSTQKLQYTVHPSFTNDLDLIDRKYLTDNFTNNANLRNTLDSNVYQIWTYDSGSASTNILTGADLTQFNKFLFKRSNQTANYVMNIFPGTTTSSQQTIDSYGNWTHKSQNGVKISDSSNDSLTIYNRVTGSDTLNGGVFPFFNIANTNTGTARDDATYFISPVSIGRPNNIRIPFSVWSDYSAYYNRTDGLTSILSGTTLMFTNSSNRQCWTKGGHNFTTRGNDIFANLDTNNPNTGRWAIYSSTLTGEGNTDGISIYCNGSISYTGSLIGINASDKRLKQNIDKLNLEDLESVDFIEFEYNEDVLAEAGVEMQVAWQGKQIGVIAQDVPKRYQKEFELNKEYLGVNYEKLKTELLQYHQEQIRAHEVEIKRQAVQLKHQLDHTEQLYKQNKMLNGEVKSLQEQLKQTKQGAREMGQHMQTLKARIDELTSLYNRLGTDVSTVQSQMEQHIEQFPDVFEQQ